MIRRVGSSEGNLHAAGLAALTVVSERGYTFCGHISFKHTTTPPFVPGIAAMDGSVSHADEVPHNDVLRTKMH